jgi:hypothetical protein
MNTFKTYAPSGITSTPARPRTQSPMIRRPWRKSHDHAGHIEEREQVWASGIISAYKRYVQQITHLQQQEQERRVISQPVLAWAEGNLDRLIEDLLNILQTYRLTGVASPRPATAVAASGPLVERLSSTSSENVPVTVIPPPVLPILFSDGQQQNQQTAGTVPITGSEEDDKESTQKFPRQKVDHSPKLNPQAEVSTAVTQERTVGKRSEYRPKPQFVKDVAALQQFADAIIANHQRKYKVAPDQLRLAQLYAEILKVSHGDLYHGALIIADPTLPLDVGVGENYLDISQEATCVL